MTRMKRSIGWLTFKKEKDDFQGQHIVMLRMGNKPFKILIYIHIDRKTKQQRSSIKRAHRINNSNQETHPPYENNLFQKNVNEFMPNLQVI